MEGRYNLRKRPAPPTPPPRVVKKSKATKKSGPIKITKKSEPIEAIAKSEPIEVVEKPEQIEPTRKSASIKASKKSSSTKATEKSTLVKTDEKSASIKAVERSASIFAFGIDTCGELGLGKIGVSRKTPTLVPIDDDIRQVACGPMHVLSLTEAGRVYSYGCNDEGALGRVTDGDEQLEATPAIVKIDGKVIKVTAGDSHSAALTDDNRVFVFGNFKDGHGSIGLTTECNGQLSVAPIQIMPKLKFKDIASGSNHMLLLDTDGDVYSFGVGAQGQLGRLKLEEINDEQNARAITAENRDLFLTPKKVNLKNVDPQRPFICDAIYAGNFASFATNTDKKKNRIAGWGLNNYYQLGYKGQKDQNIQPFPRRSTFTCSTSMVNVACGQHHTLFLARTGRVYSAGKHQYGILGLGKVGKEVCPAQSIESLGNSVVQLSAGIDTSFAVTRDGKLYSWGMGGLNLGLKHEDDVFVPTEVESLSGKMVKAVSAGSSFTSVLVE